MNDEWEFDWLSGRLAEDGISCEFARTADSRQRLTKKKIKEKEDQMNGSAECLERKKWMKG